MAIKTVYELTKHGVSLSVQDKFVVLLPDVATRSTRRLKWYSFLFPDTLDKSRNTGDESLKTVVEIDNEKHEWPIQSGRHEINHFKVVR